MFLRFVLCAMFSAAPLAAAVHHTCDNLDANASNVDWHEPMRSFAKGAIKLIKIDIEEPACCGVFLMILHPAPGHPYSACTLIGERQGYGWGDLALEEIHSEYDPAYGLTLAVPVQAFDGAGMRDQIVRMTINQALGRVFLNE